MPSTMRPQLHVLRLNMYAQLGSRLIRSTCGSTVVLSVLFYTIIIVSVAGLHASHLPMPGCQSSARKIYLLALS